jgi:hypothetical protein
VTPGPTDDSNMARKCARSIRASPLSRMTTEELVERGRPIDAAPKIGTGKRTGEPMLNSRSVARVVGLCLLGTARRPFRMNPIVVADLVFTMRDAGYTIRQSRSTDGKLCRSSQAKRN